MIQKNTTQEVRNYLSQDLSIQKNLQRGILNIRALARQIIKEQKLRTSVDAVISAIRRFSYDKELKEGYTNVESVFQSSNITTKNNIACITLRNQSNIQGCLNELTNMANHERRETLRIIKAKKNLKLIVDMKKIKEIESLFSKEDIDIKENLSEIRIKTSLKADQTKGVVARVSNEMMLQNINISEIIFCTPEIIIYINQEDFLGAYESLMNLCHGR